MIETIPPAQRGMYFVLISVLILALQVDYLSAACNTISSQAAVAAIATTATAAAAATTTTTTTTESSTSSSGTSGTTGILEGDISALLQFKPSSSIDYDSQNISQLMATNETNARTGNDNISMNEIHEFRLEYNKYKILSHLSITGNLDEIAHDIDDNVRKQLVSTTALNNPNNNSSSSRRKRSLSCGEVKSDKNACCLESFYVNFTHIGWDKWILYPTGYNANYCRGQCDLSHARYYHSTLLSKYSNLISLCCSPKQMAPLKLLYIDEENKVHQKSIPDMIVESCDCA